MTTQTYKPIDVLIRTFYDLQKLRIQTQLRLLHDDDPLLTSISETLGQSEKQLEKQIKKRIQYYPIYDQFLRGVKGIGVLLAGSLISVIDREHIKWINIDAKKKKIDERIKDVDYISLGWGIEAFKTISSLWAYAGLKPPELYEEHNYNWFLKTTMLGEQKIVDQFIMHKVERYYPYYLQVKAEDRVKHPEKIIDDKGKTRYNDGHLHKRAKRKVANLFLSDLWVKWRKIEGLPISEPWIFAHGGHDLNHKI